ncbi:hypothetical protein BX600DRAFT_513960 [Xylariales sp. PMI_506]|nr:hypothetical protein BX600DRAFT_513960 [Xylariales sp. PMI_506]
MHPDIVALWVRDAERCQFQRQHQQQPRQKLHQRVSSRQLQRPRPSPPNSTEASQTPPLNGRKRRALAPLCSNTMNTPSPKKQRKERIIPQRDATEQRATRTSTRRTAVSAAVATAGREIEESGADTQQASARGRRGRTQTIDQEGLFTGEQARGRGDGGIYEDDELENIDDYTNTPRPFRYGAALAKHPDPFGSAYNNSNNFPNLPPPRSTTSSTTASSTTTTSRNSRRSRSPVKNLLLDLQTLERPPAWTLLTGAKPIRRAIAATGQHDAFLGGTFERIRLLTGLAPRGFIPASLREELERDDDFDDLPEDAYYATAPLAGVESGMARSNGDDNRRDLEDLRSIVEETTQARLVGRLEAGWNESVHWPLLQLARRHCKSVVSVENSTRAAIAKPFLPSVASYTSAFSAAGGTNPTTSVPSSASLNLSGADMGDASSSATPYRKMIDYVFALRPPPGDPLARRLPLFLQSVSPAAPCFNQTMFQPLRHAPTGIFIETKADAGSREEGQAQLGLWVAAWYKRLDMLLDEAQRREVTGANGNGSVRYRPLLPLVLVRAESWELFFAYVDKVPEIGDHPLRQQAQPDDERIVIVGPLDIGGTASLNQAFRLLAILKVLVDWVAADFRSWVEQLVGLG